MSRSLTVFSFGFGAALFLACLAGSYRNLYIPAIILTLAGTVLYGVNLKFEKAALLTLWVFVFGAAAASALGFFHFARMDAAAGAVEGNQSGTELTVKAYPVQTPYGYSVTAHYTAAFLIGFDVTVYLEDEPYLSPGDVLTLSGNFAKYLPGEDYQAARGILMKVKNAEILAVRKSGNPIYVPLRIANTYRDALTYAIPGQEGAFALALTTGDKTLLSPETRSHLTYSGMYHIAVASGMHVAFFASIFIFIFGRKRAYLSVLPVIFFMIATGFTPSVMRAGIMQIFAIAAPYLKREYDSLSGISAAMLIILIINPFAAGDLSFILSYLSTLGIILFSGRIYNAIYPKLKEAAKKLPGILSHAVDTFSRAAVCVMATSLAACLFACPVIAVYFGRAPLIAPLSNLLLSFLAQLAFPISILTGTLCALFPILAGPLGFIAAIPLKIFLFGSEMIAKLPLASAGMNSPITAAWFVFVYAVGIVAFVYRKQLRMYIPAALLTFTLATTMLLNNAYQSMQFEVGILSVEGRAAVFTEGGRCVVVDAGGDGYAGAKILDYLRCRNISKIDLLILTSASEEATGGLSALRLLMPIKLIAAPASARDKITDISCKVVDKAENAEAGEISALLYPCKRGGLSVYISCKEYGTVILDRSHPEDIVEMSALFPIEKARLLVLPSGGRDASAAVDTAKERCPYLCNIVISPGYSLPESLEKTANDSCIAYFPRLDGDISISVINGKYKISAVE